MDNKILMSGLILFLILTNFTMFPTFAQSQQITGVVRNVSGETIPGVSVVEKGTLNGTVTNVFGEYHIVLAHPDAMVVFSFVGYESKEIKPISGGKLDVVLYEDVKEIDEVVVVGYGATKKSDLTGSVSSVKVEGLNDTPANSIDKLLQGRSAGLQVINSSQDPGAGATVRIRGGSSLRGSNSPLLVVDGFPIGEAGNLKQINPADIVSVEVLKDASASAIYGSRGANGVIMITTNRAKEGITTVTVRQQTTLSQFNSDLLLWKDPVLLAQLNNEDRLNGGLPALYVGEVNSNGVYYPSINEIQNGEWPYFTRWDKVVFRDAPVSNNTSVSINSANEKTSFNLSVNYFDEQGVYIEDDYKKGIVKLAVDHKIADFFTIRTSNLVSKDFRNYNNGLSYYRNPLWPVYNEDGTYFLAGQNDYGHPLALTEHVTNKNNGFDFISSWLADLQITNSLNLKSQVNYKYGSSMSDTYYPKVYTEAGDFNNGAAGLSNWMGQNVVSETYLTFDKEFNGLHKLKLMAGHSYEYGMSRSSSLSAYDFVNEATGNENMGSGDPEKNGLSNGFSSTKLLSFLGRLNYSYKDTYLFTATMRTDGSSKFGANNKWAYFPSGAVSWKAHNEEFIKAANFFDELKFRVSYGISGNQGISPYQTLSRYGVEEYYDNDKWNTAIGPGYVVGYEGDSYRFKVWGGIPNVDLKWETTTQTDFGLDMAFLNRKLRVVFDYYIKNTSDLLRERILSLSSGYNRMWVNDGEIQNKGFEFSIDWDAVRTKDFNFSTSFIFSKNKNKVVSLGDAVTSGLNTDYLTGMKYEFWGSSLSTFSQNPNILAIGQPINVFYGYKVDGIIQTEAEGLAAGLTGALAQPGEFKYADLNGDGVFSDKDRTVIGDPNPDFTASLSLSTEYKNFDIQVFLNGVFGNDILYQNMWGGQANTMPLRWTQDNPTNDYPSLRQNRTYYLSDWYVKDGSFVRIQNVTLGYNYQAKSIKWLSGARLYLDASNLCTFTGFKGYDPEVGADGIYWGGYPRLRKWTIGLDINF
ncbi:TonB-dependent receptor [Draconibacterium orientale]|uniref:SusC/RagA family TonB-linked outer membrane protein n=1 Tax=Draconibacterium orientale TaxID=1168034 RepID=UPI002ABE7118|nr:TonB-dependent receptor [Draconibacterium orientale]